MFKIELDVVRALSFRIVMVRSVAPLQDPTFNCYFCLSMHVAYEVKVKIIHSSASCFKLL